jgi:hypothetical protein
MSTNIGNVTRRLMQYSGGAEKEGYSDRAHHFSVGTSRRDRESHRGGTMVVGWG